MKGLQIKTAGAAIVGAGGAAVVAACAFGSKIPGVGFVIVALCAIGGLNLLNVVEMIVNAYTQPLPNKRCYQARVVAGINAPVTGFQYVKGACK